MKRRVILMSPLVWSPLAVTGCAAPLSRSRGADGWAAAEGGTRGGAAAQREHHIDVHDRAGLDAALALGDTPKLLRVHGRIDLSAGCGAEDFRDPGFDLDAYCRAYDPATWGRRAPAGALEDARRRSAARQAAAVTLRLPTRTTLTGVGADAGFAGGMLLLDGVSDVVLHNLHFDGVRDHFPAWDPEDGRDGAWNSDYDTVALRRSRHVWVHHCSFTSGSTPQPQRLGRLFQQTDGLLDITRQSDLVTVSWCRFSRHDKTMLIGGSDSQTEDDGRLRVSLHHNLWLGCKERTPRVRFGRVHIANNLFVAPSRTAYAYSIGLGRQARIVSQANTWETDPAITADKLVRWFKGTQFSDQGSLHNGRPLALAAALRQAHPGLVLDELPAFDPPAIAGLLPAGKVAALVRADAGAGTRASGAPIGDNLL